MIILFITNLNNIYNNITMLLILFILINNVCAIPQYKINLDDKPEERWKDIAPLYSNIIKDVISTAENELPWVFTRLIKYLSKNYFINIPQYLGEYGLEMIGISHYSNIPLYDIVMYNIFYELFSLCTSIIIKTDDTIIHARNLDFGVMMNGIVPLLKKITIYIDFVKNNNTIYRAHTFAGYVGIFTGMKPYKYSITINQRFALNGGFMGIFEWFRNKEPKWNSLIVRELLEGDYTYNYVVNQLSTIKLVAPVYYIVGGIQLYEGALITRERAYNMHPIYLNNSNYIFQTNHDHWIEPFYFDDRTTAGKQFLENNHHNIYNVQKLLETKPTLNRISIFSSIMIPKYNYMSGKIMNCIEPCHSINLF